MEKIDIQQLSSQALAYVGDAVYELYVRLNVVEDCPTAKNKSLHRAATDLVRASAQARMLKRIMPLLTEAELCEVRRARNCQLNHIAKGATRAEYQASTAFEALVGFLYLQNEKERLKMLLASCVCSEDLEEYPR